MTLIGYVLSHLETAKDVLVKCVKSLVSEHLAGIKMLHSLRTCTTALPSYCFSTLAKIEFENVRLNVSEILGVFVNTLLADAL